MADALLDESIAVAAEALGRTLPVPERAAVEIGLGVDLTERYRRRGAPEDLDEALRRGRDRVVAADPDTAVDDRVNLAARLLLSYDDRDRAEDLDELIALVEPMLPGLTGDERWFPAAGNVAVAYGHRYDRTHHRPDLDRAIELYQALAAGPDPVLAGGPAASLALSWLDLYRTGEACFLPAPVIAACRSNRRTAGCAQCRAIWGRRSGSVRVC